MAEDLHAGRSPQGDRPALRYRDLVSSELDTIHSTASTLLGHHVFAGNQPDDFAIGGMAAVAPRVLLLGLGLGGSIRSILAANPSAQITAVDISAETLKLSRAVHQLYFPAVQYDDLVADVQNITSVLGGNFDAILIDVYDDEGYPAFITDQHFWAEAQKLRRTESSVVMVNTWGLPTHLGWLANALIQREIAAAMQVQFGDIYALPHRRNVTLSTTLPIGRHARAVSPGSSTTRSRIDQLSLELLHARAALAQSVGRVQRSAVGAEPKRSKKALNELMTALWIPSLRQAFELAAAAGQRPTSVTELVSDPIAVSELATRARGDLQFFLPNVASNWLHQYGCMPEWFYTATKTCATRLIAADPQQFTLGWLTQYVALLTKCPVGLEFGAELERWVTEGERIVSILKGKVEQ